MPVDFMVVNRVHPNFLGEPDIRQAMVEVRDDEYVNNLMIKALQETDCRDPGRTVRAIKYGIRHAYRLSIAHQRQVDSFVERIENYMEAVRDSIDVAKVPFFETDIRDIEGIARLGEILFSTPKGTEHDIFYRDSGQWHAQPSDADERDGA